jgi:hypothetical protein
MKKQKTYVGRRNQYQSHNTTLDAYFNIVDNTKANRNAIWYRNYSAMGGINHEHEGIDQPITQSGRVGIVRPSPPPTQYHPILKPINPSLLPFHH